MSFFCSAQRGFKIDYFIIIVTPFQFEYKYAWETRATLAQGEGSA